mgnify:CR=1 FL=1
MEKPVILCKSPISLTSFNDGVMQLSGYIQIKDLQVPNYQPFANCYCNCKSFYSKNTSKSHLQLDESFEGVSPAQSPLLTLDHIRKESLETSKNLQTCKFQTSLILSVEVQRSGAYGERKHCCFQTISLKIDRKF